ncbi:augmin complex subunit dgt2-like [Teleopsis dalmanni]|uniref:augmin complex subunit dgt2-like n=1 Tax=Teleopsis dalmanni TaxID=139649 RepID=UPI0018CD781E|nr:augmin complex subunit dgt2-like [Teleopsis dalmanni]
MNVNESSTLVLHTESFKKFVRAKEEELLQIRRLRLIINILSSIDVNDIKVVFSAKSDEPANKLNIARAFKILPLMEFLHLPNRETATILDLSELNNINLSYTERKVILTHFPQAATKYMQPILELGAEIRTGFPEMFERTTLEPAIETTIENRSALVNSANSEVLVTNFTTLETSFYLLMELISKRTELMKRLVTLQNEKCAYLNSVAALKTGPYFCNEVELLHAEARYNEQKTNFLRSLMVHEFTKCSADSMEAIKEIEKYTKESVAKVKNEVI